MGKRYVIYTIMTGGYDNILQPLVIDDRFDYVLFSNDIPESQAGVWKIRKFEYRGKDFVLESRYPKINSHLFFQEYEASLYHDANIQIATTDVYERVVELCGQKVNWSGMNHPFHDCLYEELYLIPNLQYEHDYVAAGLGHKLFVEGFPEHAGFFENNIIFRTNTSEVRAINEQWWEMVQKVSRRDQFSLRYVLWKCGQPLVYLFPKNQTPRNSSNFNYLPHNSVSSKKIIKLSYWEKVRKSIRLDHRESESLFKTQYMDIYKSGCPVLSLFLWGFRYGLKYYFPDLIRYKINHFTSR